MYWTKMLYMFLLYGTITESVLYVNGQSTAIRLGNVRGLELKPYKGHIEVFVDGEWGVIKRHGLDNVTAKTVCKTLGYGYTGFRVDQFRHTGQPNLSLLQCAGNETSILECQQEADAALLNTTESGVPGVHYFEHVFTEVRLSGGKKPTEGMVQVKMDGRWGLECNNDQTSNMSAQNVFRVICRTLGLRTYDLQNSFKAYDYDGVELSWLDLHYLSCTGSETHFNQCTFQDATIYQPRCYSNLVIACITPLGSYCQFNETCAGVMHSICENFSCRCKPGYIASGDRTCSECSAGKFGQNCSSTCYCNTDNTIESPDGRKCDIVTGACLCYDAWSGISCDNDVNECLNSTICQGQNTQCENTVGGYECICLQGYQRQNEEECIQVPLGSYCQFNETCAGVMHSTCENFSCMCKHGYIASGDRTCSECSAGKFGQNCSSTCYCNTDNTIESPDGRKCDIVTGACLCYDAWSGISCDNDVNECLNSTICQGQNTQCENTVGGYECICLQGYQRQNEEECIQVPLGSYCQFNETCAGVMHSTCENFSCMCKHGYIASGDRTCSECSAGKFGQNCSSTCNCNTDNTIESPDGRKCDIVTGACLCYEAWSGISCDNDVNECLNLTICRGQNTQCKNTEGGYECICLQGYQRQNEEECTQVASSNDTMMMVIILSSVVGGLALVIILFTICFCQYRKNKGEADAMNILVNDNSNRNFLATSIRSTVHEEENNTINGETDTYNEDDGYLDIDLVNRNEQAQSYENGAMPGQISGYLVFNDVEETLPKGYENPYEGYELHERGYVVGRVGRKLPETPENSSITEKKGTKDPSSHLKHLTLPVKINERIPAEHGYLTPVWSKKLQTKGFTFEYLLGELIYKLKGVMRAYWHCLHVAKDRCLESNRNVLTTSIHYRVKEEVYDYINDETDTIDATTLQASSSKDDDYLDIGLVNRNEQAQSCENGEMPDQVKGYIGFNAVEETLPKGYDNPYEGYELQERGYVAGRVGREFPEILHTSSITVKEETKDPYSHLNH